MKRRDFIKQSGLASSLLLVPDFIRAFENLPKESSQFKKLIVIQLAGGNDGLNTIVPYTNDIYFNNRPKIALGQNQILRVNDTLGFHPGLKPLKELFDKGYVSVINNVGYPSPNRSHFRSTDIWQTASDANEYLDTGWLGRYMDINSKNAYEGIELDDSLSTILKGKQTNGIATKNPEILYRNMKTPYFSGILEHQDNQHLSEHNLGYLYKTMIQANSSANYIYETSKTYRSKAEYPSNPFGRQLKAASEFINSGLDTKVYFIAMGGFDTHAGQINRQSRLLKMYSEGVNVLVNDLENNNTFKDTLILTFSEFGRRLRQNAALGTDHGAANNVFVIGKNLKKSGLYNQGPNLANLDANGDLKYEIDFRSVYATILDKWLDVNDERILNREFSMLDFL